MLKKYILVFFLFTFITKGQGQIIFYQDVCKCGVSGAGYSTGTWNGSANGNIEVDLNFATSINKAFLIFYAYNTPDEISIDFNNDTYNISSNNRLTSDYNVNSSGSQKASIYMLNVTQSVNVSQNSYTLLTPNQSADGRFACFYLVVIYESASLKNTNIDLLINNQNLSDNVIYDFSNLNSTSIIDNVGIAVQTDILWDDIGDGASILVNGNNIGTIGGSDFINQAYTGAGVKGHFNYNDGILFGLDDDIANNGVSGSDGIAIINSNLLPSNQIELQLISQASPVVFNNYISFHLVYTTPCDTFSVSTSPDTAICIGETLQLFANGGQVYEWLPATDLNCSDCPNPIFTGDSSRFYTVRIWNNDSCSVVRPVKINVRPLPQIGTINSTPSHCGTNNGSVSVSAASGTQTPITYVLNDTLIQSSGTFGGLASGTYTFSIMDAFGCVSNDAIVTVGEINTTVANFTVSPTYGVVPLAVDFTNTSVNATDYLWSINGTDQGSDLNSYTCDTSGLYTIQLIAWQYDPGCADTMQLTVLAVDQLIIPTAFTPDNDGVNDRWVIPNIHTIYPNHRVYVYNRWGTLLYEAPEGKYNVYPWKGIYEDKELPVGSYYFIIDPNDGVTGDIRGIVSVVR